LTNRFKRNETICHPELAIAEPDAEPYSEPYSERSRRVAEE